MIDILPSPRSAIFTDTATRKLPRSFYWGAGIALLLHAGLVYYLVQQTFSHAEAPAVPDGPTIIGTVDNTPPHQKQTEHQKPAKQVVVHDTPAPKSDTDTTPLTPHATTNAGVDTQGPPEITTDPGLGTATGTGTTPAPVEIVPRWKAFPDAETLTNYYPARALDNEMEGSAAVKCTVIDAAGRVHCTVVSESPKGYGFGQQTVKMVEEKGRVDTSAGDIKIGSVLAVTTVKWQLN